MAKHARSGAHAVRHGIVVDADDGRQQLPDRNDQQPVDHAEYHVPDRDRHELHAPPIPGQTVDYSVRGDVAGSSWATDVSITWPANTTQAPVLSVSGKTLTWNAVGTVSSYEVAIVSNPTTTRDTTYQIVNGTSYTPPAVPGQTLNYSVRTNVAGSQWATVVPISWPAQTTSAPTTGKLKVGVMNLGNYQYGSYFPLSIFKNAGVKYTREDVGGGANVGTCNGADYVCTALQGGVAPIVLFDAYADSNMTSEIVSLAQHLNTLAATYPVMNNMHVIEFGNEVYAGTSGPKENATTYGQQYNAAHAALAAAGLGSWKLLGDRLDRLLLRRPELDSAGHRSSRCGRSRRLDRPPIRPDDERHVGWLPRRIWGGVAGRSRLPHDRGQRRIERAVVCDRGGELLGWRGLPGRLVPGGSRGFGVRHAASRRIGPLLHPGRRHEAVPHGRRWRRSDRHGRQVPVDRGPDLVSSL